MQALHETVGAIGAFVATEGEHARFRSEVRPIDFTETRDLFQLAIVIPVPRSSSAIKSVRSPSYRSSRST
jgi:hypothetical protein